MLMDFIDFVGLYLTSSPEVKKAIELLLSTVKKPEQDSIDRCLSEINTTLRSALFLLAISDVRPDWKEGFEQIRRGEIKTYAESKPKRTAKRTEKVQ